MTTKTDRKIVEAATPGPWWFDDRGSVHDNDLGMDIWNEVCYPDKEDNAQFIAHFNPTKVSEMLDAIDERDKLKVERDALRVAARKLQVWANHMIESGADENEHLAFVAESVKDMLGDN